MSSKAPTRQLAGGKLLLDEPAAGVVRLTIANPAKRNALDHPILDAIAATLSELAADRSKIDTPFGARGGTFDRPAGAEGESDPPTRIV